MRRLLDLHCPGGVLSGGQSAPEGSRAGTSSSAYIDPWLKREKVAQAIDSIRELVGGGDFAWSFVPTVTIGLRLVIEEWFHKRKNCGVLMTTAVEGIVVRRLLRRWENWGWKVVRVPVNRQGRVDLNEWEQAASQGPDLAMLSWASSELGTIQPVEDMLAICHRANVGSWLDLSTGPGWEKCELNRWKPDGVIVSPLSFGGPAGVAVVGTSGIFSWQSGGWFWGDEGEDVPWESALQAGEAAQVSARDWPRRREVLQRLAAQWDAAIVQRYGARRIGPPPGELRLCTQLAYHFPGTDAEALGLMLNREGVVVPDPLACADPGGEPLPLKAVGLKGSETRQVLRLALHPALDDPDLSFFLEALDRSLRRLGRASGPGGPT